MSEKTAREAIQDTVQASSAYTDDNVTLNDWSILDGPGAIESGPKLIILGSERFSAVFDSMSGPSTTWDIIAFQLEPWDTDWPTTLESMLSNRQALIDAFNATSGSARAPSGAYYNISEIRGDGPIIEHEAGDFSYLIQELAFVTEEMA